jgi:hypothetical protein
MKKILVYFNPFATYLPIGTLFFLQKRLDLKIYAIVDSNEYAEEFFKKQKMIKFEKIWFYRDYLNKKPHNIEILKKFETEYEINFWQIAFCERFFYKFNDYHKFNRNEILSILETDISLFDKIVKETLPDFFMCEDIDNHKGQLLHQICKKLNVKVMSLGHTRLGTRWRISKEPDQPDVKIKNYYYDSKKDNILSILKENNSNKQEKEFRKKTSININQKIIGYLNLLKLINSSKFNSDYFIN